jgi:ribonuclease P protein component
MPRFVRTLTQWSRSEIRTFVRKAHRVLQHPGLDIKSAPALLSYGRVLIVISKKVGTAPQRNVLRRRLKALFRELHFYATGNDWLFYLKPALNGYSYAALKIILSDALLRPQASPATGAL